MIKLIAAALIAVCSLGLFVGPSGTQAAQTTQAEQLAQSRINIEQAKTVALEKVGGKIVRIGLENHHNALVYVVNIKHLKHTFEVTVDAGSGKVVNIQKQ